MTKVWRRIELWAEANSPADRPFRLTEGAPESELADAEAEIGVKLPSDVRRAYRIHNGSNRLWICDHGYLMPLFVPTHLSRRKQSAFNAVVRCWALMKELLDRGSFDDPGFRSRPAGPIRKEHWNPRWIPITDNECGDHLCIDMAPVTGGKKGQIIEWDHEVGATRVVAKSFSEWLEGIAQEMQQGRFRFVGD